MKVRHIKRQRCRPAIARSLQNVHGFLREAHELLAYLNQRDKQSAANPFGEEQLARPSSDEELHELVRSRIAMKEAAIPVDLDDL